MLICTNTTITRTYPVDLVYYFLLTDEVNNFENIKMLRLKNYLCILVHKNDWKSFKILYRLSVTYKPQE